MGLLFQNGHRADNSGAGNHLMRFIFVAKSYRLTICAI